MNKELHSPVPQACFVSCQYDFNFVVNVSFAFFIIPVPSRCGGDRRRRKEHARYYPSLWFGGGVVPLQLEIKRMKVNDQERRANSVLELSSVFVCMEEALDV